ncbi:radical SAM protein [Streptacidiphilus jiangxiensis]|uniref:Radical SAM core domain-containing protein n=1 Tax=Streptacidiphilus jiangxiensis TaxID=235985 RepID=A0A1H7MVI1_STRJI|nr:radical SAM protein [Streptacidiphilus jiangxiensis]SEL15049.1 uncharacterized protein SAMN05414137_10681 [Streptacidiphilus jiangxiensis]
MDKVSRYLVVSERTYAGTGGVRVRLLYGTRTARTLAVDPATADALLRRDAEAVPPPWREPLREHRILVPAEEDERGAVLDRNRRASADRSAVHIALLPTSYCNMGCTYCGQEHTRGGLGRDHRDRVRDRVLRAIEAPSTRSLRLDWFGAEPMVGYAVIRSLAPRFVAAAREHGVSYTSFLVTNGSLLTVEKMRVLVRECGVTHFEITLDGPAAVHDRHRPLKNGRGSFRHIVDTVRAALDSPDCDTHVNFRTNVDVDNQDSIPEYLGTMAREGFARPDVSFTLAAVHSWGNDVSDVELPGQAFAARELTWLGLMQDHGLRAQLLPSTPTRVVCPAVTTSSEIISSTGNVFSCTEYPLVPEAEENRALTRLDLLGPEPGRPLGPFDGWHDDIANGLSWCTDCVFMPTCGGSCPKAWHEGHPPCPAYKFNIQGRLDLLAGECGLDPVPAAAAGVDGVR